MVSGTSPPVDVSSLLAPELVRELLVSALAHGAEFAEVYGEYTVLSAFTLEERRIRSSLYSVLQGVGIRAIRGEQTGYAYADGFERRDAREAAEIAARIARAGAG